MYESDALGPTAVQDGDAAVAFTGLVNFNAAALLSSDAHPDALADASASAPATPDARIAAAVSLAATLLRETAPSDPRLAAVVRDPKAATLTGALTDEVLRLREPRTAARRFRRAVAEGVPAAFPFADRALLRAGALAARLAPATVMKLVDAKLRAASSGQVLPLQDPALAKRLAATHAVGAHTNVNLLGEAIIGEEEALRRRDGIVALLRRSDVDAISVKLSAVAANISALAFDATVDRLTERLLPVYRAALDRPTPALVTLDMEEYRDLELTAAVFERILQMPELDALTAGIVLQAYLPDSHGVAARLCAFAEARHARGAAPIRIRVVKGANLAMEKVEAELRGWPLATYSSKGDVDASYKRLLDALLAPALDGALIVGLASHNLFDMAWGLGLRDELERRGAAERLEFETLEGMAPGLAAAVAKRGAVSLVYSPVVDRGSFESAIAYLVRRLDENTSPENFLHALVDLTPDSPRFAEEAAKFAAAAARRTTIDTTSRRANPPRMMPQGFDNEPDADLSVAALRDPIVAAVHTWTPSPTPSYVDIDAVEACVAAARRALDSWRTTTHAERAVLLRSVAEVIASRRADVIATMAHETSKTIAQGDPEVSEAIDFARFYAESTTLIDELEHEGVASTPRGVVVVTPPWNFPFAILMGGVCASIAAGNVVIIKPAPQAMLCAQMVAQCCWDAGISPDVVRFLPCADDEVGQRLVSHPDVDLVVLTGSIETARMFHSWRPDGCVMAETSGKNTMVITAAADIELALKDLVASAFGHAGQKCSAASLATLAPCWYDDPAVLARLADAVLSLRCGPASDPSTDVAPLIGEPSPHLLRALTTIEPGQSWLVQPRRLDDAGRHWSPGVLLGVQPGSWFHRTECFGPVLGIVRAANLDDALAVQNGVEFGLTAGLHSLDPAEIAHWSEHVEAGNLYVNRGITGAIVRRQPFGGWKRSQVGPGAKAGGPSHVLLMRSWTPARELDVERARASFDEAWTSFFGRDLDPSGLTAERNVLRHRPLPGGVVVRVGLDAPRHAVEVAALAAERTGTRMLVSLAAAEPEEELARRLPGLGVDRVRLVGGSDVRVRAAAHALDITVDDAPITDHGRVELLHWLREQSVTTTLHRHGHLRTAPARAQHP